MGRTPRPALVLLVTVSALVAGPMLAVTAPATAAAAATGVAVTARTGGGPLNVRSGPSTSYPRVSTIPDGRSFTVACQVSGQLVSGKVRRTARWDRLSTGRYIADAYAQRRVGVPACPVPSTGGAPASPPPPALPAPARATASQAAFILQAAAAAQRSMREQHVPASVTIAQAILESGWGTSGLTANDRNYFGIKCFAGFYGPVAVGCHRYKTTECDKKGRCTPQYADFRIYRSASDSFTDHGLFLVTNSRYAPAFRYSNNPKQFAIEIHKAGYATSPTYAAKLISIMDQYDLYRYNK